MDVKVVAGLLIIMVQVAINGGIYYLLWKSISDLNLTIAKLPEYIPMRQAIPTIVPNVRDGDVRIHIPHSLLNPLE